MKQAYKILILTILLNINLSSLELATIGTGSSTGTYYATGANICLMTNKNRNTSTARCNTVSTKGSVYNINAIISGKFNFGIAQNDIIFQAYNGIEKFKNNKKKNLRSVMKIYEEPLTLIVTKESNIQTLEQIKGKRINIGVQGSGTRVIVDRLLSLNSLIDTISISELNTKQTMKAMQNGTIDGFFIVTGHPNPGIKLLALKTKIDIVNIDTNNFPPLNILLKQNPYYSATTINEGTYSGVIGTRETFGVSAILITNKNTNDTLVTSLIDSILKDFEDFKQLNLVYKDMNKKSIIDIDIPLHNGVKTYYKDKGLIP